MDEIGYEHNPYTHCPKGNGAWKRGKCDCDVKQSFGARADSVFPLVSVLMFGLAFGLQTTTGTRACGSGTAYNESDDPAPATIFPPAFRHARAMFSILTLSLSLNILTV